MSRAAQIQNWSEGSHGRRFTHDFFRFPGKFHPPIIENILRAVRPEAVADPMAGSGTVAVEAKAAGIPSLNLDVDPVSVFFAQVKTTPIDPEGLKDAWSALRPALQPYRRPPSEIKQRMKVDLAVHRMRSALDDLGSSQLEDHTHWFRRYVLVDYARIDHQIHNGGLPNQDQPTRNFFWACLMSGIRRISLADPAPVSGVEITKHMQAKLAKGYPIDVFGEFERRVELGIERMRDFTDYLGENQTASTKCVVARQDSANLFKATKDAEVEPDLILFSPPYCNAIEYWRRHRLEYLLGRFVTPAEMRGFSKQFIGRFAVGDTPPDTPKIGHRPTDEILAALAGSNRLRKAWQLWHYFNDMRERLEGFHKVLPPGGRCIIIVGDSRTGGHHIPTAKALERLGTDAGFEVEFIWAYPIKNRVMQYPLKAGYEKIHSETIISLKRSTPRRLA